MEPELKYLRLRHAQPFAFDSKSAEPHRIPLKATQIIAFKDFIGKISGINILQPHPSRKPLILKIQPK